MDFCSILYKMEGYPQGRELQMLKIPSALQAQFETTLRQQAVPQYALSSYLKWLLYEPLAKVLFTLRYLSANGLLQL
jgi:hypothetical protein